MSFSVIMSIRDLFADVLNPVEFFHELKVLFPFSERGLYLSGANIPSLYISVRGAPFGKNFDIFKKSAIPEA